MRIAARVSQCYGWAAYNGSRARAKPQGHHLSPEGMAMGPVVMALIMHPADTHCRLEPQRCWVHCSAGSLLHRQLPPWDEGGAGVSRRPQSVSWGLGVGEGGTGLTGKGDSVKEPLKRRVTCSTPNPGPVQGRECWGTRGTVLRSRLRIWTGCAAGAGGEGEPPLCREGEAEARSHQL